MTKYFVIATIVCSFVASCVNDPTNSQELGWCTSTETSTGTATSTACN